VTTTNWSVVLASRSARDPAIVLPRTVLSDAVEVAERLHAGVEHLGLRTRSWHGHGEWRRCSHSTGTGRWRANRVSESSGRGTTSGLVQFLAAFCYESGNCRHYEPLPGNGVTAALNVARPPTNVAEGYVGRRPCYRAGRPVEACRFRSTNSFSSRTRAIRRLQPFVRTAYYDHFPYSSRRATSDYHYGSRCATNVGILRRRRFAIRDLRIRL
jgi:hypothetical protein